MIHGARYPSVSARPTLKVMATSPTFNGTFAHPDRYEGPKQHQPPDRA
jgi:hypothetical protein